MPSKDTITITTVSTLFPPIIYALPHIIFTMSSPDSSSPSINIKCIRCSEYVSNAPFPTTRTLLVAVVDRSSYAIIATLPVSTVASSPHLSVSWTIVLIRRAFRADSIIVCVLLIKPRMTIAPISASGTFRACSNWMVSCYFWCHVSYFSFVVLQLLLFIRSWFSNRHYSQEEVISTVCRRSVLRQYFPPQMDLHFR